MEILEFKSNDKSTDTSIKVSIKENNPDGFRFKMHKWQGDSEKGLCGYQELVALEQCIEKVILHMFENHKKFLVTQTNRYLENKLPNDQLKPLTDVLDPDNPSNVNFYTTIAQKVKDIDESDAIDIGHTALFSRAKPKKEVSVDNLKIHVGKWQGDDTEIGSEGIYRLIVLKDSIHLAKKSLQLTFESLNESIILNSNQESECSI